jgi:hypothetical protein
LFAAEPEEEEVAAEHSPEAQAVLTPAVAAVSVRTIRRI